MSTIVTEVWSKSKWLIKGGIIVFLVLLLMIPTHYVQQLIYEREARQKEAIAEISSKWAGRQTLTGPIVVLPFWQTDGDSSAKKVRTKHYAFFLPDELSIKATVTPREKYRGIYKVMLYNSTVLIDGAFKKIDLQKLNILPGDVIWSEAFVKLSIADVKGLNEEGILNWNGQQLLLSPQSVNDRSGNMGLTSLLPLLNNDSLINHFSARLDLNGSEQILFTPVGKSTDITLTSTWPHPSFSGDILPQTSDVKQTGFTANWKSLAHKRPFPQQWKDDAYSIAYFPRYNESTTSYRDIEVAPSVSGNNITASAFGTGLFVPVNGYQKTMRSVKYAVLCIVLTFAAFFLIETTNKRSVHPFQYGLIGLALVLFYTLLLSFSEYIGFNWSYIIASTATIGLIGWYVRDILSSNRLSGLLAIILVLIYTYIFTILQLQDFSLLIGSIGLFITLGVIMYFSRRIQW